MFYLNSSLFKYKTILLNGIMNLFSGLVYGIISSFKGWFGVSYTTDKCVFVLPEIHPL